MKHIGHKPILRGSSYVCLNCGTFLLDVRTSARLRALRGEVDPIRLAAVERRFLSDPKLAEQLVREDPQKVVSQYKFADKFNDFLMNPQARPDLQTPEAQQFLQTLQTNYLNDKTDEMTPWLTREWKKGRIQHRNDDLYFDGGEEYGYPHLTKPGEVNTFHRLTPDQLNHWGDWYRSDHPSRQGQDIMQMQSPDLHRTIKDWDQDMRARAQDSAQVRGDIEHHYPDGWTVQRLNTEKALRDEGQAMGHCVGGYWPSVQNGDTLIYSLRDHHNKPHATWEVAPRWFESDDPNEQRYSEPYMWTDEMKARRVRGDLKPVPHGGTMVQIQGKANEPPLPEYQQRIKDYFQTQMPNERDRPRWEDQIIDDLEGMDGEYTSYHEGDYGLNEPNINYNWDSVVENLGPGGWGGYGDTSEAVNAAQQRSQLPQLERAIKQWVHSEKIDHRIDFDERFRNDPSECGHVYPFPQPHYRDFPNQGETVHGLSPDLKMPYDVSAYNDALDEWEERRDHWIDQRIDQARQDDWTDSEWGRMAQEWEEELARERLHQRREEREKTSKARSHTNFHTGEPCNCTFVKHLSKWSAIPSCEVCGDLLEHGKCKRCDWGQWSNAMGTENPPDPTRDLKPAIQA